MLSVPFKHTHPHMQQQLYLSLPTIYHIHTPQSVSLAFCFPNTSPPSLLPSLYSTPLLTPFISFMYLHHFAHHITPLIPTHTPPLLSPLILLSSCHVAPLPSSPSFYLSSFLFPILSHLLHFPFPCLTASLSPSLHSSQPNRIPPLLSPPCLLSLSQTPSGAVRVLVPLLLSVFSHLVGLE